MGVVTRDFGILRPEFLASLAKLGGYSVLLALVFAGLAVVFQKM